MKEAPRSLIDLCRRGKTRQEHEPLVLPGLEIDSPEAMERFRQYAKTAAPEAVQNAGGRKATIAMLRRAGDYGLSYSVATEILCEEGGWNETKAFPPWDENELLDLAESLGPLESGQSAVSIRPHSLRRCPSCQNCRPLLWLNGKPAIYHRPTTSAATGLARQIACY
jgi:hypothetical protein